MGAANELLAAWQGATEASALRARLAQLIASAREAWPGVELAEPIFLEHLGARLESPELAAIDELHSDDLWLACACSHGDDVALQSFERFALAPAVAALVDADMPKDELLQQLRVRLLVRDGDAAARIEQYGGRGSLRAWTRIAVLRAIKDDRRARARRGSAKALADDLLQDPTAIADPELEEIRRRCGTEFRAAFAAAVSRLDPESRRLLRQHHLHGITLDALARIYGIHRVTTARRLAKARAELLDHTRRELVRRLKLDRADVERTVGLLMSRLELSVERLLASRDDL